MENHSVLPVSDIVRKGKGDGGDNPEGTVYEKCSEKSRNRWRKKRWAKDKVKVSLHEAEAETELSSAMVAPCLLREP